MAELESLLDLAVAETALIDADFDTAVAAANTAITDLNVSVKESGAADYSTSLNLEMQVEDAWAYATRIVDQYGNKFVRLLKPADEILGVVVGNPHTRLLTRVSGVLQPSLEVGTARVVVALNIYVMTHARMKILVCDDSLSKQILELGSSIIGRTVRIIRKGIESLADIEYEIVIVDATRPNAVEEALQVTQPYDLSSFPNEAIVGSLF